MTDRTKPLWHRIMFHWLWMPGFTVYFLASAYWQDSILLGIIAGMFISLCLYNLMEWYDERKAGKDESG